MILIAESSHDKCSSRNNSRGSSSSCINFRSILVSFIGWMEVIFYAAEISREIGKYSFEWI